MKTIPTAKGSFTPLLNLYSALRPLNFVEQYNKKYGDFYRFKIPNNPLVIVVGYPQAVKEFFTAPPDTFASANANQVLSFLVGDNSILLLDNKAHKNRRHLLMPLHGESLQKYSEKIVEITNKVSVHLQVNNVFSVRQYMQEITLRVILNIGFGIDSSTTYERLRELLIELLETFNTPLKSLPVIFPALQKDWGKFSPWGRYFTLESC